MSDSVRPQRRQPTRLPRPWDSPGKNTGVCVRDLIFLSREGRDLGVAFQAPPGSQASSRGEAKARGVRPRLEGKPRTPLSSRVATRVSWSPLSPLEGNPVDEGTTRRGTDTPCIFRKNPQVPHKYPQFLPMQHPNFYLPQFLSFLKLLFRCALLTGMSLTSLPN